MNYENKVHNKGTYLIGPIEVIFDNENSFQPDFIYVSAERQYIIKDYIYGAPDIVVEVLWKKKACYDLRSKKDIYEKYGVKEYIIIDPIRENADLYLLKYGVYYLHQKAQKTQVLNSVLLPGFGIELSKFFK